MLTVTVHLHVQCSLNELGGEQNKECPKSVFRDSLLYTACVFQSGTGNAK